MYLFHLNVLLLKINYDSEQTKACRTPTILSLTVLGKSQSYLQIGNKIDIDKCING